MHYLKDLFVKGRYHLYIGFTVLIQSQRRYLLPQTNLYKNLTKTVRQELQMTQENSNLSIEAMNPQEIKQLKAVTKRKVEEIQSMNSGKQETLPISLSFLALGSINYFLSPTSCAIFVGGYLTLMTLDFVKSISVLKFGCDPLWSWKMKDMGYVIACCFGAVTFAVITRQGISKLKEKTSKALALRRAEAKDAPQKKQ